MMFGFGAIMMLFVLGLPVLLVVVLIWGLMKHSDSVSPISKPKPVQVCPHCGTDLQTGWTHCTKCGAPINSDNQ